MVQRQILLKKSKEREAVRKEQSKATEITSSLLCDSTDSEEEMTDNQEIESPC